MGFEALKQHAMTLPGATEDIKWGADWVASVGGKMFFCGGPNPPGVARQAWTGCSFKVDEHRFLELTDLPGLAPAPYLARHHWVRVADARALPLAELKALVERSHALVLAGLPKKRQREICGQGGAA
jgi:predicted DNA-binding protein (MmcQ/YjbR family)